MKYRRLSAEELKELEKEFIDFLVSNTVTASDWVFIKENDPLKAERLIALFSDVVLERVLERVTHLELREPKSILLFECGKDGLVLLGISVEENVAIDFTNENDMKKLAQGQFEEGQLKLFKSTKKYSKPREEELFAMTEQGCFITDATLFNLVNKIM